MERGRYMSVLKSYRFPIILLTSIIIGVFVGLIFGKDTQVIKPLGDLFLNAMFTIVVPLVFFSISSAIANMDSAKRVGKIIGYMLLIFAITGIIASIIMLIVTLIFPPASGVHIDLTEAAKQKSQPFLEQVVAALSVNDFPAILSKSNMLALIVFSGLVGLATNLSGESGRPFAKFLTSASDVSMKLVSLIMYYAPIGLGAYFATLVGIFGPTLLGDYFRAVVIYYPVSILYFFIGFTFYAFLAGGGLGVRTFWKNILSPAAVALGTSSSVATIPSNIAAAEKTGVPKDIRETVIPIGATIHMDGSCLSAILKISFLFGIFNKDFHSISAFLIAIGIALLSGMVMSGIPGGGFVGEMLIVTMYSFPTAALPILAVLGSVVDPPATLVNAIGDNVASMLVARLTEGKNWMKQKFSHS
jgi:Na+/H+-dicarboxylate symporter